LLNHSNWKSRLLGGALIMATFTAPAFAQISFGIVLGRTPPPVRYERRPPPPAEGYAWVDGYWGVNRGRYVWVPGVWQRPPYEGAYWNHPHYEHQRDGWHLQEGHWDHEDHSGHSDDRPNEGHR
jgi:hypothetical protein